MKIALVAMLVLVCAASTAEARPRHVAHQRYAPECNVSMPCEGVEKPAADARAAGISQREARRLARSQELYDAMPFGMPTDRAGNALPAS